jgi:beta-lactamase superfamily II metal-dependent hydrolase
MKLKIIASILVAATLGLSLCSCSLNFDFGFETDESFFDPNVDIDTENSIILPTDKVTDTNGNGTVKATEKIPSGAYLLFQSGSYKVNAVMPDRPTDIENTVYARLRSKMKSKTGTTLQTNTDYLISGQSHSTSTPEILVGLTNYDESKTTYEDISYGTYGIKILGKKIVFYFSTLDEGLELVESFMAAIQTNSDKAYWISNTFSVSNSLEFKTESIPKYPTATTSYNCYDDTTMLLAKNSNLTDFNTYCGSLTSNGFTEYSKRDNVNGNYFRTYTKGTMALTVYFNKSDSSVRIISGPLTDIPPKDTTAAKETNATPSVSLIYQGIKSDGVTKQASGLGMVFLLPNGKFIIYDGGYYANNELYNTLVKLANGEDIVIASWIISHPHPDHEQAFDMFLEKYAKDVRIETVMYNFTSLKDAYGTSETIKPYVSQYLDGKTVVIKPHTGQIYNFGHSTVEILHTVEDFMPKSITDINWATMVVRITVDGTSTLLLGDAYDDVAPFLTSTYGSYLKSDMVQLAHHGTYPGTEALYTNINAQVLFWPSDAVNAKNRYNESGKYGPLRKAISVAKDVYLASEGTVTLTLPYTIKNNKDAFLNRVVK